MFCHETTATRPLVTSTNSPNPLLFPFLCFLSSVFPPFQGEICLCTSRVYVERSIYPQFLEKFVAAARKWKTGAPSDPGSNNGALISKEHLEKVVTQYHHSQSESPFPPSPLTVASERTLTGVIHQY